MRVDDDDDDDGYSYQHQQQGSLLFVVADVEMNHVEDSAWLKTKSFVLQDQSHIATDSDVLLLAIWK